MNIHTPSSLVRSSMGNGQPRKRTRTPLRCLETGLGPEVTCRDPWNCITQWDGCRSSWGLLLLLWGCWAAVLP